MTRLISDNLLILDTCLTVLAKSRGLLNSQVQFVNFLKSWCGIANHIDDILICLQKNSFLPPDLDTSLDLLSKAKKKAMLKAFRTSKKLKYIDNPKVAKEAHLTTLIDK